MIQNIDMRSDTVTQPTPAMRRAMADAPVGDDVFGEDPSINQLRKKMAALCGKEAALFVPSGTMANQIAINSHTQPGDEVICEYGNHIFNYESGGPALLSGVQVHPLHGERGVITAEHIAAAIRPSDHHFADTRLIEIENTHNRAGGAVFPLDEIKRIRSLADEHGLSVHLDGARLWNAHVATGISLAEWCTPVDSVSLCFSKGLGAPVGSILVGSFDFIDKAHRYRKMYGGGMRQAGILAAAALYAVEHHVQRLADDHKHAKMLANKFIQHGALVDLEATQTNIVVVDFAPLGESADVFIQRFGAAGLLALPVSPTRIRFVTHIDVNDSDLERALNVIDAVLA